MKARNIAHLLDTLKIGKVDLAPTTSAICGLAFAAQNRDRITRFVIMDAPLPVSALGRDRP